MIYPLCRRGMQKVFASISIHRSVYTRNEGDESLPLKSRLGGPARRAKLRSVNPLPTTFNDEGMDEVVEGWDSRGEIVSTNRDGMARAASVKDNVRDFINQHEGYELITGITVTKETNVGTNTASADQLQEPAPVHRKARLGKSEDPKFKYREGEGLRYTVSARRA